MKVVALGVRGSTPAPGGDFLRYGGHTSCIAVYAGSEDVPHLVLDAGTGLRSLPQLLRSRPFDGDVVLTHLHWDHLQGLPFCPSIDRPDARVRLHVPVGSPGDDPLALLAGMLSPPHFPIGPDGLHGDWTFRSLSAGPLDSSCSVFPVDHKGGTTFGVRVGLDGASFVYLPDHRLTSASDPVGAITADAIAGVDVLLHDGQFVESERSRAFDYGHATIEAAMALADDCAVGRLLLTHHAPARTDDEIDALAAQFARTPGGRPVGFLRQDEHIEIRRR